MIGENIEMPACESMARAGGLVAELLAAIPVTRIDPTQLCCAARVNGSLMQHFDWVVTQDSNRINSTLSLCPNLITSPQTVFATAGRRVLTYLLTMLRSQAALPLRFLVLSNDDERYSHVASLVASLKPWFHSIYFEGLDIRPAEGVRVFPIGLMLKYIVRQNISALLGNVMATRGSARAGDVLAAWGKQTKLPANLVNSSNAQRPEWVRSRVEAGRFCERHHASDWLNCSDVSMQAWWEVLPRHRFMLSPTGNGIQSPKLLEAWLAGVVPVCLRSAHAYAFTELAAAGWPVAVVDEWEEVASEARRDAWWAELQPRLERLRASAALTVEGYWSYLNTGTLRSQRFHTPEPLHTRESTGVS